MKSYLCCTRWRQCSGIGKAEADSNTTGPNDTPFCKNKTREYLKELLSIKKKIKQMFVHLHPTSSHGSVSESFPFSRPDE